MPPAFDSTKQAAAFAILLLFCLASPWLAHKTFLPGRENTFSSQSIRWEPFPWLQKLIYGETNDIDIAFVGSSHMGWDIDTPYVQQKLNERLGRKSVVRSICWSGGSFDGLYFFTRDLLEHRRVKTLVVYDECSGGTFQHPQQFVTHWYHFGDNEEGLKGWPPVHRAVFYFAAVIGMPKNFLEWFRPNLPHDPAIVPEIISLMHAPDPATRLGSVSARTQYNPGTDTPDTNFSSFEPVTPATPADLRIYRPATATNFLFSNKALPGWEIYFARQFGRLATDRGCQVVFLHLPVFPERTSPMITESRDWTSLVGTNVCLVGIPEARLFAGLSDAQLGRLFYDAGHLNENGQHYFTPLITPALLNIYENHFHH